MQILRQYVTSALHIAFITLACVTTSCEKKDSKPAKYRLNLNINQSHLTLDPRKGSDLSSVSIQFLLFEGLVQMTPYATRAPAVAEKLEVSEDLMKYSFTLREAYWSNGSPITAYDFVQTWKDTLNPNFLAPNAHLLYVIKNAELAKRGLVPEREIGIRALDHKTIEVYLERPTPHFLDMLSFAVFNPVNQSVVVRNTKWADSKSNDFVSNGPFRVKEWRVGDHLILEKNPYYWDKQNVELEEIYISLINCEQTALKLFEQGEIDFLGLPFTGIVSDSVPDLMDKGQIRTTPLPGSTMCCFNVNAYPFTNKNIRKAFAYAINRQEIIENVTLMNEENGLKLLPKSLGFESEPFFEDGDIERAQDYLEKGLEELGTTIEKLGSVKLLHASSGIYPKVAKALKSQWLKVLGINVKLEGYEYKIFLDKLTQRDYQMGQCVWIAQYLDPMNFFDRFRTTSGVKNYPGYYNPEYENILKKSSSIKDSQERFSYLKEAEKILMEDMPLTPIYHWNNAYLIKDYVHNFQYNLAGGFYFHHVVVNDEVKKNSLDKNKKATPRLGKTGF